MFGDRVSDSRVYVFGSNTMHAHVPEGQPRGHPMCWCPSLLVGKELESGIPRVGILVLEFFNKRHRIVVSYNLLFMRAKIFRQDMQKGVLTLLEVNVKLLLLFWRDVVQIKEWIPGQTPPVELRTSD